VQSDDESLQYLLANAGSGFHCACTCELQHITDGYESDVLIQLLPGKMGKDQDANAVVTTTGKVRGLKNLRIVDASTFPLLPPGHLLATVCMAEITCMLVDMTNVELDALAEKFADDIKAGR
jgi:choline dehydrogenase